MAFNAQKGIVVAVIIFAFASMKITEVNGILGLGAMFMVYSMLLSYFAVRVKGFVE